MHQAISKLPRSLSGRVYYEAIHLIVRAIYKRVHQESFSSYAQMEALLVKAANGDDYEAEFSFLKHHTSQMLIQGIYNTGATKYFGSYVKE